MLDSKKIEDLIKQSGTLYVNKHDHSQNYYELSEEDIKEVSSMILKEFGELLETLDNEARSTMEFFSEYKKLVDTFLEG